MNLKLIGRYLSRRIHLSTLPLPTFGCGEAVFIIWPCTVITSPESHPPHITRLLVILDYRYAGILIFASTYKLIHATGGIVIFGVGLESSNESCSVGIYLCIVFYATSKALIYFFLGKSSFHYGRLALILNS
jgi:hypothetical protein